MGSQTKSGTRTPRPSSSYASSDNRADLIGPTDQHMAFFSAPTTRQAEIPHSFDLGVATAYQALFDHWRDELNKRYLSNLERRIFRLERARLQPLLRYAHADAENSGRIVKWAMNVETVADQVPLPKELERSKLTSWNAEIMHSFYLGQKAAIKDMARDWESGLADTTKSNSERAIYRREAERLYNLYREIKVKVTNAGEQVTEAYEKEEKLRKELEAKSGAGLLLTITDSVDLAEICKLVQIMEAKWVVLEADHSENDEDKYNNNLNVLPKADAHHLGGSDKSLGNADSVRQEWLDDTW